MNIRIQIIIAILLVLGIIVLINMIRNRRLELRYALIWMILAVCILILDIIPGVMTWLARVLGIASPVNMLFFLGFCFSLMIIFTLTVAVSRMSIRIKQLTQQVALYEKKTDDRLDEKEQDEN